MYRVDHMEEVSISHADRLNHEVFDVINLEEFANRTFGLSFKRYCDVTLNAHISLVEAVIDRFGMNVEFKPVSKEVFTFTVPVAVSPEFFGWVISFGGRMKIVSPGNVRQAFVRAGNKGVHGRVSPSGIRVYYSGP